MGVLVLVFMLIFVIGSALLQGSPRENLIAKEGAKKYGRGTPPPPPPPPPLLINETAGV